jgi:hypothetical protein
MYTDARYTTLCAGSYTMDAELWWNLGTCNKAGFPLQIGFLAAVVLTRLAVNLCARMSNLMKTYVSSACAWNVQYS